MILHTSLNTDSRILDDRLSYYQAYQPKLYGEKKAFLMTSRGML
jgi:hypothetical protein